MSRILKAVLLAALAGLANIAAGAAPEPLVFAIHPFLPPADLQARFTPLANLLGAATGRPVIVRVGRTYEEHDEAIGTDAVDIAYMGPAAYVSVVSRYGPKPILARQVVHGDPMLRGEIIVRQDSAIESLQELKGKRFAFGDRLSAGSYVVAAAMLRQAGVPESALGSRSFLGSHKNVALAVLAGDYDAGAVDEQVFDAYAERGLRSLAPQTPVPEYLVITSAKLPAALRDTLRRTLLHLQDSAEGRAAMAGLEPDFTQFVPAQDSDYDGLRAIMRAAQQGAR